MTYECVCEPYEGESADFSDERYVIASKVHICCECKDAIQRGDLHQVIAYRFEGEFGADRTCLFCVDERARNTEAYPDLPPVIGDLACWLVAELRGEMELIR